MNAYDVSSDAGDDGLVAGGSIAQGSLPSQFDRIRIFQVSNAASTKQLLVLAHRKLDKLLKFLPS